jgi:hypothetical protein
MEKSAARAAHDLMLRRIGQSLKDEDRDNARMWRDVRGEKRLLTLFDLSDFNRAIIHSRGFPLEYEPLEFPRLGVARG